MSRNRGGVTRNSAEWMALTGPHNRQERLRHTLAVIAASAEHDLPSLARNLEAATFTANRPQIRGLTGCWKRHRKGSTRRSGCTTMRTTSVIGGCGRGQDQQTGHLFSYVSAEDRMPVHHPLRTIRPMVDAALTRLSPRFETLYSRIGRPSIPPEQLLRALLGQVLYSVRSERLLMEQLQYNLLFRSFVGLNLDDPVWVPTVFSKNRDRLLDGDIAQAFLDDVVAQAWAAGLLSDDQFTFDGTLLEAWASQKSFRSTPDAAAPRDDDPGNPTVTFRGEKRSNQTHRSTTDPDARLYKKADGQAGVSGPRPDGESSRLGGGEDRDRGRWPRRARCRVVDADPQAGASDHAGRRQGALSRASSPRCGNSTSPRTSRNTPRRAIARVPSTAAPRGMRGTRSVSENANWSKRPSAG